MKPIAFIILVSCGFNSFGGEIADYYFKQQSEIHADAETRIAQRQKSRSFTEIGSTNHGITEIGIERTGCFGTCPSYTFIVRSDGNFKYSGDKYAERTGDFIGTIPSWKFTELAQFIRDSDYMNLETDYRASVTDMPTTYTMVVMNGKKKTISNYAGAGPTKLWAIEQLIDDLMAKADWKPVEKPEGQKK